MEHPTPLIFLVFQKNKSKYLAKTLQVARRIDTLSENDNQCALMFSPNRQELEMLYHLLKTLYDSHAFRTVEIAVNKYLLSRAEVHELWNTLSCLVSSGRVKHIEKHCHKILFPHAGEASVSVDDPDSGDLVVTSAKPKSQVIRCARVFYEVTSYDQVSEELFQDTARRFFCDLCPNFKAKTAEISDSKRLIES